jgi:hypothetical protein
LACDIVVKSLGKNALHKKTSFYLNIKMARPTKMIIITSNEDIIRKFSMNKNKNTHIIDLNDAKKISSGEINDKNTINLAFLTQLSELVCILF